MAPLSPVAERKSNPILLNPRLAEQERLEKPEVEEKPEIMLFNKKAEYVAATPKATATIAPVREQVAAVSGSSLYSTPLFEYANKTTKDSTANMALFNFEQKVASLRLTKAAESGSSGDKHDEGNQFTSAHKGINELRLEKLLEGDVTDTVFA